MFDEYLERFISTNDPLLVALLGLSMCLTIGWAVTFYSYRRLRQTLKHQQTQEQRMQSFMASLSHHLRTPLNGIMGYAEYIHSSSQEPMVHFTSKIILENSLEMLHLLNGMLDLNKIKEGQLQLSVTEFDVYDLSESVRQLHQARATRLNIQLQLSTNQQTNLKMTADPYRLRQVLNHLVDNAITFNRPKGEVNLQLMHNEAGGTMTFTVTDTGLGIACDVQDHLFTDLSALGAGFPAKDKTGTVLGLRLSHQLVQLMGGKLDYRTEAGVGSSFFFTLPMHSPAEQTT
jgi:two-component system, NarL family, sensor histidine kinase BarA